ncbi:hypothetical protein PPAR_a2855 [Pseudoalteromonas paragorgicola KMM 3548]|nr:hypothetical protein [Pseudoalteromonas distincta KMM 3548]
MLVGTIYSKASLIAGLFCFCIVNLLNTLQKINFSIKNC